MSCLIRWDDECSGPSRGYLRLLAFRRLVHQGRRREHTARDYLTTWELLLHTFHA